MLRIFVYGLLGSVFGFMAGLLIGVFLYEIKPLIAPLLMALLGLGSGLYLGVRKARKLNSKWVNRPFATPLEASQVANDMTKGGFRFTLHLVVAFLFASIVSFLFPSLTWDVAFELAFGNIIVATIIGYLLSMAIQWFVDQLRRRYGPR